MISSYLFTIFLPFLLGSYFVSKNELSISSLIMFIQISNYLFNPLSNIFQLYTSKYAANKLVEKIDFLTEKSKEKNDEILIDLKNNRFRYILPDSFILPNGKKILLKGNINNGVQDKVLVEGKTGIGKTYFFKSIAKLYKNDINATFILEDKIIPENYFLYVDQNPYIFRGTLEENLTFGRNIEKKLLHRVIQGLDLSYLYNLSNELLDIDKLSGGEKARISLARSILLSNKVLILDEVMASLDVRTSEKTYDFLDKEGVLYIEIAHKVNYNRRMLYQSVLRMESE